ncbi:TetR family transcriptional regulator [Chryseobacterium mucoviscidosis]|uniref:TetR/AcrR family transcriptional regulator n=1 Tax=unclassified Paenibacillus TaxID=185978 RepID=UPI0009A2A692|nr:TetR/AcrR family transcriptional regulator [Paenibacillus sp. 11B]MDN8592872.1 TetR/AcrR family transcriptional regulator [Paenibacillus sp. 11B]OPG96971.1 TetR family transcriptional regulator [Chryseobacterium mucoviscidosis]
MKNKQYLIADARREQIIHAAIEVLTEIGYFSTSLSKIAKRANTSTGLISYHFSGKEDLMNNTLLYLVEQEKAFMIERVEKKSSNLEKLMAYIEAGITYRAIKRGNTTALLEIVFNVRTPDNVPYFRLEINPEDELNVLLEEILHEGQQAKEFQDFDPKVIAMMIRGAVSLSMSLPQNESILSFKDYTEKVTKNVLKMIQ